MLMICRKRPFGGSEVHGKYTGARASVPSIHVAGPPFAGLSPVGHCFRGYRRFNGVGAAAHGAYSCRWMPTATISRHCTPEPPDSRGFNRNAVIPFGVTPEHIEGAMRDFAHFLGYVDAELERRDVARLEDMLMPANFSSIVGEFMSASIPKHCKSVVKNNYHIGHPDLLPAGRYPNDMAQHAGGDGIEIKASRYLRGWQGHNPEEAWLMVFVFAGGRPSDVVKKVAPEPFRFVMVLGALLEKSDWLYAGRSETSRRTITASVTKSGYEKMAANWIYRRPT